MAYSALISFVILTLLFDILNLNTFSTLRIFCKVVVITHIEYQYDSAFHFTELLSLKLQDKCTRSNEK